MDEMTNEQLEQYHYEYLEWCKSEEEKEYLKYLEYEAEKSAMEDHFRLTGHYPF
jgi:hypothetical protein